MQANGIARQATHLGHVVPHIRVIRPTLHQLVQHLLGLSRLVLFHQQVGTHLFQRVVARVQPLHPFGALLGVGKTVVGDVQVDLRQVVGDVVGRLGQQRLEHFTGLVQLPALDLCQGQAITCGIQLGVFVQLGAEALGGKPRRAFVGQCHPGADQLVAHAVFNTTLGRLVGAVTGVGNT
ncbi:hypothetical protein D3C78_1396460 [compost metagenome]